jgi:type II secretory pathway pseudopilin PulG
MESKSTSSRPFRFRLRTLLIVVAVFGLLLAVVVREVHLRAELQRERASAEANFWAAQAAVDQFYTQAADRTAATGPQNDQLRRELLERTERFYRGMESKASSADEKVRAFDRARQLRIKLEGKDRSDD